jgi:hypothetical protein
VGLIKITSADRYFSLCVRERADWRCERCKADHPRPSRALHCAHWHSRGSWTVRFDQANALALCYGCHVLTAKDRDAEHRPLMQKIVGDLELDRLAADKVRPSHGIRKRLDEIAQHYRLQYAEMTKARMDGHVGRLDFEGWTP